MLFDWFYSFSLFLFFPISNSEPHLQREISELSFHNAKLIWIVQKKFTCDGLVSDGLLFNGSFEIHFVLIYFLDDYVGDL